MRDCYVNTGTARQYHNAGQCTWHEDLYGSQLGFSNEYLMIIFYAKIPNFFFSKPPRHPEVSFLLVSTKIRNVHFPRANNRILLIHLFSFITSAAKNIMHLQHIQFWIFEETEQKIKKVHITVRVISIDNNNSNNNKWWCWWW